MTFIANLLNYIDSNTTLSKGVNLFIGEMEVGKNGLYIIPVQSQEPDRYTDTKYFNVDMWTKTNKSVDGYTRLGEMEDLFHQKNHYFIGSYRVYYSNALGQVIDFGRDGEENKLLKLTMNFIVQYIS
jgi:hypothetical protein